MSEELRASTGAPQKQVTVLTEEGFKDIEKTPPKIQLWGFRNSRELAEYYGKKEHQIGQGLDINGYNVKVNPNNTDEFSINGNGYFKLNDNVNEELRLYDSVVYTIGQNVIRKNPHTGGKNTFVSDGKVIACNINELGEIGYITQGEDGKISVKRSKISKAVDVEGRNYKTINSGEAIGNFSEIYSYTEYGENLLYDKSIFITEDGKIIVVGKQEGDEGFSIFIDGKKVDGISNIHKIKETKRVGDDTLYVHYTSTNGVDLYAKVFLGEAVKRRGDTEVAVAIARDATTRVLEGNARLIGENGTLSEQVKELTGTIGERDETIGNQNRTLEEKAREIERLNRLVETLRTKSEETNTENGRLKSENQGLNTKLSELNTKIDGLVKVLEGFKVKAGGTITRWTSNDEDGLKTFFKNIISTVKGLKK